MQSNNNMPQHSAEKCSKTDRRRPWMDDVIRRFSRLQTHHNRQTPYHLHSITNSLSLTATGIRQTDSTQRPRWKNASSWEHCEKFHQADTKTVVISRKWRLPTWSRNVDKQYVIFGCIRVINAVLRTLVFNCRHGYAQEKYVMKRQGDTATWAIRHW